ncbi:MAG: hypothetical protein R3Y43_02290 [Alphaproteobacteria bacterium]
MHIYRKENKILAYAPLKKINGLPVEGENYHIRVLDKKDVANMVELSSCIYNSLRQGQECFIHKHNEDYYNNMIDNPNMVFVGAVKGKQLIAMSYLHFTKSSNDLFEEFPCADVSFLNNDFSNVACLGADSVHPEYRGNNINANMVKFRTEYAKNCGVENMLSIIDRKNIWNMKPYFGNDFFMIGAGVDPSDGGNIAFMHKNTKKDGTSVLPLGVEIPFDNYSLIDKMFKYKRVGIGYNAENSSLIFACNVINNQKLIANHNNKIMEVSNGR